MKKNYLFLVVSLFVALSINAQETITCAQAKQLMPAQKDAETDVEYIVVGYVTKLSSNPSPSRTDPNVMQQRFFMDDVKGSIETVNCYWCDLPAEYKETGLNIGDKISVKGKIINYNDQPELKNAPITMIERAVVKIDTIDATVCEALDEGSSHSDKDYSDDVFRVYGRLKGVDVVNNYGQHTFDMACGDKDLKAYLCAGAEGLELGKGDSVKVTGKLYNYVGVIEISGGKIELIVKCLDGICIDGIWYNLDVENNTAEVTYRGAAYYSYSDEYSGVVTIPASVTYNGESYSVTSIGEYAFADCSSLRFIAIPNSVTSIGDCAFTWCYGLTSVTIPNSVTSIGDYAFGDCRNLTLISVETGNVVYDSRNNSNAIIETATNTLVVGCQNTIIPNSITNIGNSAFQYCYGLTSMTIPNSVISIGDGAFSDCSSLTSVTIPNSVTSIGNRAFQNCYGLTSVTIPNSVTNIGESAFVYCNSLKYLTIGNGVTSIGDCAFCGCDKLAAIYVHCQAINRIKEMLSDYAYMIQVAPSFYSITAGNSEHGYISIPSYTSCDETGVQITAYPDEGYHFVQWNDGNTDNPRTVVLTQDTSFIAQFAKNSCSISLQPDQAERGSVSGAGTFEYLDEKQIEAIANYGYHFTQWSDGVADNPRTIVLTQDTSFVAQFAKNTYTISLQPDMAEHGSVSGSGTFEYLDEKQIEAIANYGYHFTAWSDGVVNNPRVITLVGDTTFTALFDVDKSGTCGDNNALTWTYNDDGQLTISGNGTLNSNYTFGVEAPVSMRKLIIESGVSSVGNAAFKNQTTLNEITISHGVNTIKAEAFAGCTEVSVLTLGANLQSIGANAFDGCKRVEEITVYAERVIDISATTFANIGNKKYVYVYVPEGSLRKYERDEYWSEFDLHVIGATGTTVEDNQISVATTSNTADVTWPAVTNAVTYELAIKDRDGNAICTLIFNAQGQLTSIAFAAPGRPQQAAQTTGFTFTVTGLDSGSKYGFTIDAKDENGVVLDHKSGSFETTSSIATGIDNHETDIAPVKVFRNGQLFILRGDKTYTIHGQEVR